MKKLLFLLILISAASLVKAQAKFEIQPFNKLPDSVRPLVPQTYNKVNLQRIDSRKPDVSKQYAYNPMPIVSMEGRSNMPVVKMQGNSKMPVTKPDVVNVIEYKQLP